VVCDYYYPSLFHHINLEGSNLHRTYLRENETRDLVHRHHNITSTPPQHHINNTNPQKCTPQPAQTASSPSPPSAHPPEPHFAASAPPSPPAAPYPLHPQFQAPTTPLHATRAHTATPARPASARCSVCAASLVFWNSKWRRSATCSQVNSSSWSRGRVWDEGARDMLQAFSRCWTGSASILLLILNTWRRTNWDFDDTFEAGVWLCFSFYGSVWEELIIFWDEGNSTYSRWGDFFR
jgi:hypothetical protein